MVQKKIPMRQCLGCREMFPKRELIRVVRSPEGELSLDFKGKAPGRGAYLCGKPECLEKGPQEPCDRACAQCRGARVGLRPARAADGTGGCKWQLIRF